MHLRLNQDMLHAAYAYFAETEPFVRWNLPDAADVRFKVVKSRECFAWHDKKRGKSHIIAVSSNLVATTMKLMETMAHEMCHLYVAQHSIRDSSSHGRAWQKARDRVCFYHGFDPKSF